ncbi:E3 ubiquitin-protein ligase RNF14 [Liparis tanakae]|uniref:RBR-type E3 ubiquitin transferase n=1 Tax=Liparis tanakae TaxID=230148 RepID=A0A4Z2GHQ4_9TELE|nr:E3 ubiquitin-protein ligase RNF14 [Liparis tanakae]
MNADMEEQEDELLALNSIFDSEEFVRDRSKSAGEIRVSVELPADFTVTLKEGETLRKYEISYLPPLLLTFELPEDYPSSSAPSFSLTCSWLTHTQLSALGAQLTDLYQATGGAVVLFSWVQFLKEDALRFLDIHALFELPSDEHSIQYESQDSLNAALSEPKNNQQSVPTYRHSYCVQLAECGHIFCKACLRKICTLKITEGNVKAVSCPEADCSATPSPSQVKSLVGEELFSRYDRLLLQSTLDHMADVVYCPRPVCGSAVIVEKSSAAAQCPVCRFAFCVVCKKNYHGTENCPEKRNISEAQHANANLPQSQEGLTALWDDYASGSRLRRRLLESRYGRSTMQSTVVEYLSEDWITFNSKNCPHCFWMIQKNGGCNMMTCSQCGQLFCWSCLTRMSSHSAQHFGNGVCSQYQ